MTAAYTTSTTNKRVWHYSWGFFNRGRNNNNFVRLMDCTTGSNGRPLYTWVADEWAQRNISSGPQDPEQPRSLYHPDAANMMRKATSDFRFLRWSPNYERPDRPQLDLDFHTPWHPMPPLYEVIDCKYAPSEDGLRATLQQGIPYSERPSSNMLVVFRDAAGGTVDAAALQSDMFTIEGGLLKLSPNAPYSVPLVTVNKNDIRYVPRPYSKKDRWVYASASLPPGDRKIAIRPFEDYVHAYIQWLSDAHGITVNNQSADDKAELFQWLTRTPETLEEFLGAPPSEKDLKGIRDGVRMLRNDQHDQMTKLLYQHLKSDQNIMNAAKKMAVQQYTELVEREQQHKSQQLQSLTRQCEEQQKILEQLHHDTETAKVELAKKHDEHERYLQTTRAEIETKQQALRRLKDDVALQMGLKMFGVQPGSRDSSSDPMFTPYSAAATVKPADTLAGALRFNLNTFGVKYAVQSIHNDDMKWMANRLLQTLRVTRVLCIDGLFASALANALSYALAGKPAQHAGISPTWCDTGQLDILLNSCDSPVVVLDNVMDTVNESVLFALGRQPQRTPIAIIPVNSYANMRLVAPEIWNGIFYVPTAGLTCFPNRPETVQYASGQSLGAYPSPQNVLDKIHKLRQRIPLDAGSLTMPAAIRASEPNNESTLTWIFPHLCIQTYGSQGIEQAQALADLSHSEQTVKYLNELLGRIDHGVGA